MASAPQTLPADFFSKQQTAAPDTLPADFFSKGTPSRGGRGGGVQGSSGPGASRLNGNVVTDVLSGIADTTVKTIPQALKFGGHAIQAAMPISPGSGDAFKKDVGNIVDAQVNQGHKAAEAWRRGDRTEAVGHAMAAALPLVGPAAADVGETIGGDMEYADPQHPERATGVSREPQVARGVGQGIGLAASVSPRNVIKPLVKGAAEIVGKIPVPERLTPEGMYQSSLRPSLARKNLPKIDSKVQTGLRERIPVDRSGLSKTSALIDDLNTDITEKIKTKSDELGPVVNPLDVAKPVNRLRPTFQDQVNPASDVGAINKSKAEFLRKHTTEAPYTKIEPHYGGDPEVATPTGFIPAGEGVTKIKQPLTLSEAQAEKVGTYRQLRKKYGELGSADVESQKALARGLKDEIAKRVPGVASENAREGGLLELQTELEKMVAREGNKNILGLVPATMAHNPYGFLATLMMDNPAIKSRIAILLNRARNTFSPSGIGNAAAATAPLSILPVGQPASPDDLQQLQDNFNQRRVSFPALRSPNLVR